MTRWVRLLKVQNIILFTQDVFPPKCAWPMRPWKALRGGRRNALPLRGVVRLLYIPPEARCRGVLAAHFGGKDKMPKFGGCKNLAESNNNHNDRESTKTTQRLPRSEMVRIDPHRADDVLRLYVRGRDVSAQIAD